MIFPVDHYAHFDKPVEWLYFWGKLPNGFFFHFATFRLGFGNIHSRATHWSLHNGKAEYFEELENDFGELKYNSTYVAKGNRFSINTKHFGLHMIPETKPVIHRKFPHSNYYSIPLMKAEGYFYPDQKTLSDVWMDHEFSEGGEFSNWDWIGMRLDCGIYIMVFDSETRKSCSVSINDEVIHPEFSLGKDSLSIGNIGISLILHPFEEEEIFHPKFGIPYSEVAINILVNGKSIGYGMRERTYKEEKIICLY